MLCVNPARRTFETLVQLLCADQVSINPAILFHFLPHPLGFFSLASIPRFIDGITWAIPLQRGVLPARRCLLERVSSHGRVPPLLDLPPPFYLTWFVSQM